jgi:nucleoside-diphosphate-sugar epimerase
MPRLLVIGHGYLGQELARQAGRKGWEVIAVSRSGGPDSIACDVGEPSTVAALPTADWIVHCAASGRGGAEAYRHVYLDGCRNLTESFPETPLLFTSSTSVYHQTGGETVDETSLAEPDRETGMLLLDAERVVLSAGGTVARLSGIYGPERSVLLKKFLNGEALIEEDGRRFLNQIHRDDAASAILHLIEHKLCGVFNVCDSFPMSQVECYRAMAGHFGRPLPPSGPRDFTRKRGWTHKRVSNFKLRSSGWVPEFPCFLDALDQLKPAV